MDSIDVGRLTDVDFELLCKDLFEAKLDVRLEIFTRGPDAGIDIRYASMPGSADIVIQCKHWMHSGARALIRHIKTKEKPKVATLKPNRYILATTASLSRSAKDTLCEILAPYVIGPGDIYGIDEIVSELRSRPEIVKRHFRLWLSSTSVLQGVINREALTRSAYLLTDAHESAITYVPNETLERARDLLERRRVCLIVGIPGIGKTTLANILLAVYASKEWAIFDVAKSVDEIYALWNDSQHQVFYFDDFLGQTSLQEKFSKNEDARLIKLFALISKSPNKRLILTTREYLLEQARINYEPLARQDFSPWNCIVSIESYTRPIRAKILYNHLFFTNLSPEVRRAFANEDAYAEIIDHPNFSPRLIQQSLAVSESLGEDGKFVRKRVLAALDHPAGIWDHIIQHQVEPTCSYLLMVLLTLSQPVRIYDLYNALTKFLIALGETLDDRAFKRALKITQGTMLKPPWPGDTDLVMYHNPSIRDYMEAHVRSDDRSIYALLISAIHFEQIAALYRIGEPRSIEPEPDYLTPYREELSAASIRTFTSAPTFWRGLMDDWTDEEAIIVRAITTLEISLDYQLSELAEYTGDKILSIDFDIEVLDPRLIETLADYVNMAHMCVSDGIAVDKMIRSEGLVAGKLDSWLFNTSDEWFGAWEADRIIYRNGFTATNETLSRIEETLQETAQEWLEGLAEITREPDWDVAIDDLFEYLERFPNPGQIFPHFQAAKDRVESLGLLGGPENSVSEKAGSPEFEEIDIASLYKSFSTGDDDDLL
ncbi:restriction endonuclease [Actinomadura alba]|uniref:Restriction endonuclease n=1 Tax=Actinomadura alba TaxID=406431 RepID=A0ABR7LMA9_9ACTN|nr:restriction endonuclease [Actinomadura alba]MBC6465625.1 restriction endonuclease [Actinomadura alba]